MVDLKITAYGGVNEIGGNQILLEKESKLFLDFGLSFSRHKRFYDFPLLQPKNLKDLLNAQLIPELPGLYRDIGIKPIYNKQNILIGISKNVEKEENYAGVLITHAHMDHYYYITLLRDYIPIYLSPLTKKILELKEKSTSKDWKKDSSYVNLNELNFSTTLNLKEYLIKSYPVDHSLPGATSFIITVNGKNIAYTGDLRFHGIKGYQTQNFKEALIKHDIDILISEGTKIIPENKDNDNSYTESKNLLNSEKEVEKKFEEIVKSEDNLIIYDASYYDFDRLKTIWRATIKCGRKLILPSKQAYFVNELKKEEYGKDFPNLNTLNIFLNPNKGRIHKEEKVLLAKHGLDTINYEAWKKNRKNWELELMNYSFNEDQIFWKPMYNEILKNASKYVIFTVNGARLIKNLKTPSNEIIGTYIYGKTEAFDIETELKFNKLKEWVDLCNLNFEYAHSSGHLSEEQLIEFINDLNPNILIPIHTEAPERFEKILNNPSIDVRLLERGKTYQFNI